MELADAGGAPEPAAAAHARRQHYFRNGAAQPPPPSDDLWLLVLRATRDPLTICSAARVCRDWSRAAQEATVWAEADVGTVVRRYVLHHRCLERDRAIAQAGRDALQRLKLFRAFTTWRHATPAGTGHGEQMVPPQGKLVLEHVWAPPSPRAERAEAGYGDSPEMLYDQMVSQVSLDTETRTLGYFIKVVLVQRLGFQVPCVYCGMNELISGTEAEWDGENGDGDYAQQLSNTLANFASCGVANGTPIDIDDDRSDRTHRLIVHSCIRTEENSNPTITLRSKLGFHRAHGRAMLHAVHKSHQSEIVPQWPQGVPLDAQYDLPTMYAAPVYSSPDDAVFEQDTESQQLADAALRWCAGARADRLRLLAYLDVSGLGVSVPIIALVCNAARKTKSLKKVVFDHCAMLDCPPTNSAMHDNGETKAQVAYKELRAALTTDGVSISDISDTLAIKVVDERGVCVHFRLPGRRRLQTLFLIYSVRQGGEWDFFYKQQRNADGHEEYVWLQASDSPRRIGMVPHDSDRGEEDASHTEGILSVTIHAKKRPPF